MCFAPPKEVFMDRPRWNDKVLSACGRIRPHVASLAILACVGLPAGARAAPLEKLQTLPATFVLSAPVHPGEELYDVYAVVSGQQQPITGPQMQKTLTPLALPSDPAMTQSLFQFQIQHRDPPVRQYNVFIAATQERCAMFDIAPNYMTQPAIGRFMEIYSVKAVAAPQILPVRSISHKICTNDTGQLMFELKGHAPDGFEVEVSNYRADGKINNVVDFFIQRYVHWQLQ
jgi:hypothetical protein